MSDINLIKKGNELYQKGDYERAIEIYEEAIKINPQLKNIIIGNIEICKKKIGIPSKKINLRCCLIGYATSTGNGGMNLDIFKNADWITDWLIMPQLGKDLHAPYTNGVNELKKITYNNEIQDLESYFSYFDAVIFIENPFQYADIDKYFKILNNLNVKKIAIPMWEWWPENEEWVREIDCIWCVTKFTKKYFNSLSILMDAHGVKHRWKNKIYGDKWGVFLNEIRYQKRVKANKFVFNNGNGGYLGRKGLDIVVSAFSTPGMPDLIINTQCPIQFDELPENIKIVHKNFESKYTMHDDGDVYIYPSYWEGLCHGIYEAQAAGACVITTNAEPMSECGTPFMIEVENEDVIYLKNKGIKKNIPSAESIRGIVKKIYLSDISELSESAHRNIKLNYDLADVLNEMKAMIIHLS